MSRKPLAVLVLAVAVAVLVWVLRPPAVVPVREAAPEQASAKASGPAEPAVPAVPAERAAPPAELAARQQPAQPAAVLEEPTVRPLPASLRDTAVDGELLTDANGRFLPTRDALALFDYYLSAYGEEPLASLRARILDEIEARLSPEAAREAMALLDLYLQYRQRATDLIRALEGSPEPDAALARLRELRRLMFGPELAETLFGQDEAYDRVALEQRRVLQDPSLPEAERQRRLQELEQELPEPLRESREQTLAPLRLMHEEQALREQGASAEEIRALREQAVGRDAAARLEALDRERAAWQRRVEAYRAARQALEQDAALSPEARAQAVRRLQEQSFEPHEQARIELLDRVEQEGAASGP